MAAPPVWLSENWFQLLQSGSIVGGILIAIVTLHRERKTRRLGNLVALTEAHRELWSQVFTHPELGRVLDSFADISASPPTFIEERFVNSVFVHLNTTWELLRADGLVRQEGLAADVRNFISLPIPKAVWECSIVSRNPGFVAFVEKCREMPASETHAEVGNCLEGTIPEALNLCDNLPYGS